MIGNQFNVLSSNRAIPGAVASLPVGPSQLVGRADVVANVLATLSPDSDDSAASICAISGLPGAGKTALALVAAHEAVTDRAWFPGGVVFLDMRGYDAEGGVNATQAVTALVRAFGVSNAELPPTADDQLALYRSLLTRDAIEGRRVLLVIDNVSGPEQVRDLIPPSRDHRMLVTSRDVLGAVPARQLAIGELTPDAAVALLSGALWHARPEDARPRVEAEALAVLADLCGGLPLALQIIAEILIADPGRSFGGLAEELAAERLAAIEIDGILAPVRAAFGASYRRLSPKSSRLFRLLTVNPGVDFGTEAVAAILDAPAATARAELGLLVRAHLIEERPIGSNRWSMHDLIRSFATDLSATARESDGRNEACSRLFELFERKLHDDELLSLIDGVEPLIWFDVERLNLVGAVIVSALSGQVEFALHLASHLHRFLDHRKYFEDAIAIWELLLREAKRIKDGEGEAISLMRLGEALFAVRRFDEAAERHRQAIDVHRRQGDLRREQSSVQSRAGALFGAGRLPEAVALLNRSVLRCRKVHDRPGEALALNSLGALLRSADRLAEAVNHHEKALEIAQEIRDDHIEGEVRARFGTTLRQMGRVEDAINHHTKAAAAFHLLGERFQEAHVLDAIGSDYFSIDRFDEAISYYRQALKIQQEIRGRANEKQTLNNLGVALTSAGRIDEGIPYRRQAAQMYHDFGDLRLEADLLLRLGRDLVLARRFNEALEPLAQAAESFRCAGLREHEVTSLNLAGLVYGHLARFDDAATHHHEAISISQVEGDLAGEGSSWEALGITAQLTKRRRDAVAAFERAAAIHHSIGNVSSARQALISAYINALKRWRLPTAIRALWRAQALQGEQNPPATDPSNFPTSECL